MGSTSSPCACKRQCGVRKPRAPQAVLKATRLNETRAYACSPRAVAVAAAASSAFGEVLVRQALHTRPPRAGQAPHASTFGPCLHAATSALARQGGIQGTSSATHGSARISEAVCSPPTTGISQPGRSPRTCSAVSNRLSTPEPATAPRHRRRAAGPGRALRLVQEHRLGALEDKTGAPPAVVQSG